MMSYILMSSSIQPNKFLYRMDDTIKRGFNFDTTGVRALTTPSS